MFTLVFPPWGVGLEQKDIPKQVKKDELLIIGHTEKIVVVAFLIVDTNTRMRGQVPRIILGWLSLGRGKILHVIAWKEPHGELMDRISSVFSQAVQGLSNLTVNYSTHSSGNWTMKLGSRLGMIESM